MTEKPVNYVGLGPTEAWSCTWDDSLWFVNGFGYVSQEIFWANAEPMTDRRSPPARRRGTNRLGKGRRWRDRTTAAIHRCADCDGLIVVRDGWAECDCDRPERNQRASA